MVVSLRALFRGDLAGLRDTPRVATKKEAEEAKSMDRDILDRLQVASAVAEEEKIFEMDSEIAWERLMKTRHHVGHYGVDVQEDTGSGRVPAKGEVVASSSGVIALPPAGLLPIRMEDFSPRVARYTEEYQERMLKSSTDIDWVQVANTRAYMDPTLRRRASMMELAVEMWQRGMLRFVESVRSEVSMFTVMKKVMDDGRWSLRLIMDLRYVNLYFQEPPSVVLGSPAAMAEMELSEEVRQGRVLASARGDIPDFFYRCGLPEGLSPYFCLKGIKPLSLWKELRRRGVRVARPTANYIGVAMAIATPM